MLHDPVIVHIFGPFLKKWKYLHKFSMCKDYDPPTVYQNAFKMEEEGHSLCTLKKNLKWVRTRGGAELIVKLPEKILF